MAVTLNFYFYIDAHSKQKLNLYSALLLHMSKSAYYIVWNWIIVSQLKIKLLIKEVNDEKDMKNMKNIQWLSSNTHSIFIAEREQGVMNTLGVNRLLKKLEAAIASGQHQQAAALAKELARLKISCSVIRQRSNYKKDVINVNMYIEDKKAHQGPIPLQVILLKFTSSDTKLNIIQTRNARFCAVFRENFHR